MRLSKPDEGFSLINFEYLADLGLIADDNLNLFQYADTASEAWEIIKSSKMSD